VILAVLFTVIIANWGGGMDEIRKSQIQFDETQRINALYAQYPLTPEEFQTLLWEAIQQGYAREGLDKPFAARLFYYLRDGLTLTLGRAERMVSDSGSRDVSAILLERLPPTLLLIATAQLLLFFISLFLALFLSRNYGSWLDRVIVALAPTSAAPGWFYGIFLILIFAAVLGVLPFGRMAEPGLVPGTVAYGLSILKHMILPVSAIIIGAVFASIYGWRTFFLIYSSEEYVELARAKGLSSRAIERRYILRPTLPPIITSFALIIITVWLGMIILESVFNWPGIGSLYYQAMRAPDTPVLVAVVVIYGYLLAATVLLLDFVYALLDPRVRIGGGSRQ
jgi:peptide/nickel transport system permease protein